MKRWLMLVVLAVMAPASEVLLDEWFVGTLGGTPSATLHQRVERLEDGRISVTSETRVVIARTLGKERMRLEIRDRQRLWEDAAGNLVEGHFEHDEGAGPVVAQGRLEGRRLRGQVLAQGRTWPIDLPLPEDFVPRGDHAFQKRLGQGGNEIVRGGSLALLSNRLVPVRTTATPRGRQGDDARWDLLIDVMPVPMQVVISPQGQLRRMTMALGPMAIVFTPSEGPVQLVPADLSPAGLVRADGPAPVGRGVNRLRLPTGVHLGPNPFQVVDGDLVTVADQARPEPPQPEDLAATALCEADTPDLVTWAAQQTDGLVDEAERAERLRSAVRAHITTKDLSVAEGSALQTWRTRTGDCSEHATLLAAVLRSQRIPARIVVGLVYSAPHGGWVGHAWTEAWVAGSWTLLDAAYPGIARCRYLALSSAGDQGANGALVGVMANLFGKTITVVTK